MRRIIWLLAFWLVCGAPLHAQVADSPKSAPTPAPAQPANSSPAAGSSSLFGKELPAFNPGTEIMEWDGKHWNVNNQRFFQARFEKYLNAPEETSEEDLGYQQVIRNILKKLAPENYTSKSLLEAWELLPQASNYVIDSHLCDALADAVYSVWRANRAQDNLKMANAELERQRSQHELNSRLAVQYEYPAQPTLTPPTKNGGVAPTQNSQALAMKLLSIQERLVEVRARIAANNVKQQVSEVQARIEFQALIVQFFLQRRFQHVVMATRFYRHLFDDGDTSLKVGKETKDLFAKGTGMPPTVGVLDSTANEAMRDVREGVEAYNFLLQKHELESATKRLAEAFIVGEYMPEIRTLPRDAKRQALEFTQRTNRLISALDVRDYALAGNLVKELETMAKDFDSSQPRAAIETTKTVAAMHLAKAKNAAVSGDQATFEAELKEAATLWPRNPLLAEVAQKIFTQGDIQQKAIADLEQLLSQHNYRQIYDDKLRFIAATAVYPERQAQLKEVLEKMQLIEGNIARSTEIAKLGNFAGAWEGIERMYKQFPDDTKLNQLRASLTTEASDFVRSLRTAQQLEDRNQIGSSLAWYLKTQKIYPPSEFAQEGIARLVKKIIPNS